MKENILQSVILFLIKNMIMTQKLKLLLQIKIMIQFIFYAAEVAYQKARRILFLFHIIKNLNN